MSVKYNGTRKGIYNAKNGELIQLIQSMSRNLLFDSRAKVTRSKLLETYVISIFNKLGCVLSNNCLKLRSTNMFKLEQIKHWLTQDKALKERHNDIFSKVAMT